MVLYFYLLNSAYRHLLLSSIISLVVSFFHGDPFSLSCFFASCTFGCDTQWSALYWDSCFCLLSLRICVCLSCNAPFLWVESIKYVVLSPRPLRALMKYIAWYSKIFAFCMTLSPILRQFSMELATKYPAYMILSWVR